MEFGETKLEEKFRNDKDLEQAVTRLLSGMKNSVEHGGILNEDIDVYTKRFMHLKRTVQGFIDEKNQKQQPVLKKDKVRMELFDIILTMLNSKLLTKGKAAKIFQEIKKLKEQYETSIRSKIEELKKSNEKNMELIKDLRDLQGFVEIVDIQLNKGTIVLDAEIVQHLQKSQLTIIKRIKDLQDQLKGNEDEIKDLEKSKEQVATDTERLIDDSSSIDQDTEKDLSEIQQMQLDLKNKELNLNKKEIEMQGALIQCQQELREFEYFFKVANVILIQSTGKTKESYNELRNSKTWRHIHIEH